MSSKSVGIFPASGGIGGSTVTNILKRLPPKDLVFIARSPEKLENERRAGATVKKADYDDTSSLEHAFDGLEVLFLISYASVQHEHRTERHRVAIDAALKSGVKYIFYGSLGFGGAPTDEKTTVAHVMRPHIDTEKYLESIAKQKEGFGYTIIREGLYCESYPLYLGLFNPKQPSKEIKIPHDGSGPGVAWVKREELGEGNAELIKRFITQTRPWEYLNKTVLLSGSETLSLSETAAILGEIAKTPVAIRQITDEQYAEMLDDASAATYSGAEPTYPWGTWFEAIRRGETAYASPLLKELLGREPQDFKSTIESQL